MRSLVFLDEVCEVIGKDFQDFVRTRNRTFSGLQHNLRNLDPHHSNGISPQTCTR